MIQIKKILCPTDFSEFSHHALDVSLVLAKWYRSEVAVVHVIPKVLMPPQEFPYVQAPVAVGTEERERAFAELGQFVHKARESGITTEVVLEDGDPVPVILEFTKKLPADLIVLGSHGRSGVDRLLLGSVTEKLLRKSTVPVLTVPRALTASLPASEPPFKKILCPVDFSPPSLRALEFAFSLAEEADARLTLMNVLEWGPDSDLPDNMRAVVGEYRKIQEKEARERLQKLVPENARQFCDPEVVVVSGRPSREILDFASAHAVQLIVMGVHGRGALNLIVYGSQTQHVVREAACPVLTIRSG